MATKPAAKAVKATKPAVATKPARVPLATMRSKMVAAGVSEEAKQAAAPAPAPVAATEPAPWDDAPTTTAQPVTSSNPALQALSALAAIGIKPEQPAPVQAQPAPSGQMPLNEHPLFAKMGQGIQPTPTPTAPVANTGAVFAGNASGLGTSYSSIPAGTKKPEVKKNTTAFFGGFNTPL